MIEERSYNELAARWRRTIQPVISRFLVSYLEIKKVKKIGSNEDNYMKAAFKHYENKINTRFKLEKYVPMHLQYPKYDLHSETKKKLCVVILLHTLLW